MEAAVLVEKFGALNASANSIETLSAWCTFHRRHCKQIVSSWAQELSSATPERKLAFLFLASDVVQTSRKRGVEFVEAFAKALPGALRHVLKHQPDATPALRRLVAVWEERRVFGAGRTLAELKQAVGLAQVEEAAAGPSSASCAVAEAALARALTALQAAQADGDSLAVAAARGGVISALRAALASHEEAASAGAPAEPAAPAPAAAQPAAEEEYDPGEQGYDPSDGLISGLPPAPAAAPNPQTPMAAVMGALAFLPAEQREALGAALTAAAAAAAVAEEGEPASKRPRGAES